MTATLHLTKIAYGCDSVAELRDWLEAHAAPDGPWGGEARITTRYLPTRAAELAGGSLYWIHAHVICGRSPILGFAGKEDGRHWLRLAPCLIPVAPMPRRAHQGWRYLAAQDAPADLAGGATGEAALPPQLAGELARLGLI